MHASLNLDNLKKISSSVALVVCALLCLHPVPALADLSQEDITSVNGGTSWFSYTDMQSCGASAATPGTPVGTVHSSADQVAIAKIIMGIAKTDNLDSAGALIGVMTGLDESTLTILANPNVPISESYPGKQGDGSDHDSVGVFQQRPSTGWSTLADGSAADSNQAAVFQLMDPAYAAEAFFGGGNGTPSALSKGLINISNWRSLQPWDAAQRVQGSFDPTGGNYKRMMPIAQSYIDQYWAAATPVPLPVPLNGAGAGGATSGSGSGTGSASTCASNANYVTSANCTDTATGLNVRQKVVFLAQAQLACWKGGSMRAGFRANDPSSYSKYSQNNDEAWCADFVSWIYNVSGYPIGSGSDWRVAGVDNIKGIGEKGGKFAWFGADSGYTPQPGDIVIHEENGESHTNLVVAVSGKTMTLIGGDQGSGVGHSIDTNIVSGYPVNGFYGTDNITGYVSPTQGDIGT